MGIIAEEYNSICVLGNKGKKFEVRYCPQALEAPWSIQSRGQGYYFLTLREVLAFASGRSWIGNYEIKRYQDEIMAALDRKWNE